MSESFVIIAKGWILRSCTIQHTLSFSFPILSWFYDFANQNSKKKFIYVFCWFSLKNNFNESQMTDNLQNAWLYLTIGLLFILGSSLIIHMVFFAEEFSWVAKYTKDTLFVSAVSCTTFTCMIFNANLIPLLSIRSSAIVAHSKHLF